MYANIVSFTPTDPSKNYFTYKIPKKLTKDILIGQLVLAPWGKKETFGVVIEIQKETQVKNPKAILKVISPLPVLLPNHIELLKWMSWYYHAPMLDCLKAMLPNLSILRIVNRQLSKTKKEYPKQTLILVPTINQIQQVLKKINKSNIILIYHKQLPTKELWQTWWDIFEGKAKVVIGTRSAVFTQVSNLKKITIFGEDEPGFKNIQSPYFDTLTVASQLSKLTGAKLIIKTLTPKIETYFHFSKNLTQDKPKAKPKTTIVDLFKKNQPSNSTISDSLRNILIEKIKNKKPVLLFLNRVRESGQIYCAECKFSGYSLSLPEVCPNCKGENFKFYSLNLKSLASQIATIEPKVGIKTITEKGEKQVKRGSPTITLATSAIFAQKPKKFALVCHVLADTILNLPDFTSSFQTFRTIIKLSQLADKDGEVLIQTYNPSHQAIKFAAKLEFEKFYHEELVLRKKLELPPYTKMVKLNLKLKSKEKALNEAQKLKTILERKSLLAEVSDPIPNWQGKSEFNIIIKARTREELEPVLAYVPSKWKIVVDPESLL